MQLGSQELENVDTGEERSVFAKILHQDTMQCETKVGIRIGVIRPHLNQTKS